MMLSSTVSYEQWIISGVLVFISAVLSSSVGIGGGALYTPILILVFHTAFNSAFGAAKALIFATMSAAFILDRKNSDQSTTIPLAFFLEAPMLAGTVVGVLINAFFPPVITSFCLVILLCYNGIRSIKKGLKAKKDYKISLSNDVDEASGLLNESKQDIEEQRPLKTPYLIIVYFVLEWCFVLTLTILRGSIQYPSPIGIDVCSYMWWGLTLAQVPLAVFFSFMSLKVTKSFPRWSKKKCTKLFSLAFVSGFIASALGIGGAMVMTPALLSFGYTMMQARSASIFIILFSASASFIQYALFGALDYETVQVLAPLAFFSALFGLSFMSKWLKRSKKVHVITILLGSMILVSMCMVIVSTIIRMQNTSPFMENFKFHNICVK
ncbi:hypothetical protein P9112_003351 [Eukaryota sp. TZLM1-RC]